MTDTDKILSERGITHGDFTVNSYYAQKLKDTFRTSFQWSLLHAHQKEALDMIAHKIGRILAGNPNFEDHWVDIAGYATLVVNEVRKAKETNNASKNN